MNTYWQLLIFFFAALNPASAALVMATRARTAVAPATWQLAVAGGVIALVLYAATAAGADWFLDALDIEPESFRVAAGVVMMTVGAFAIWRGAPEPVGSDNGYDAALFPVAIPLLVTPAGLAAAITYGADDGASKAIMALVIPLALGVGLIAAGSKRLLPALDAVTRVTGALLVAVAAGLIVDGVRAI